MKRYQITERFDWFSQKEIFEIIKNLKDGEKVEIIKLDDDKTQPTKERKR